ncbi:hypothetical protein P7D17_03760 [Lactococcus petauri]|uniref:Uncharacterized protein n=1 Tax=Lactococcus petauri TaxID=1940789 RepID=A0AAJ2ITE2_9LACT|nr:hypothetical protein [Lactococcus petauri]MDT2583236.1 hypothetical protein [Lactococcus petauri]
MENLAFLTSPDMISHDTIAENIGIQPRSVLKFIDIHKSRLEEFGPVSYEFIPPKRTGRPRKVYLLNKSQALQVIDWTRNLKRNNQKAAIFKDKILSDKEMLEKIATKKLSETLASEDSF